MPEKRLMKPRVKIPVLISTALVIASVFLQLINAPLPVLLFLVSVFPFSLLWTVLAVIRYDEYKGPVLKDQQEWGYADRPSEELGTFY